MKKLVYLFSVLLLVVNGAGALYGGWSLITDPSGSHIGLPLSVLKHSPFPHFLIPGIILFNCIGIFSFTAVAAFLLSVRQASLFVMAEGVMLSIWIIIQLVMTRLFHPLQVIVGLIGMLLIGCGWLLHRHKNKMEKEHKALTFGRPSLKPSGI